MTKEPKKLGFGTPCHKFPYVWDSAERAEGKPLKALRDIQDWLDGVDGIIEQAVNKHVYLSTQWLFTKKGALGADILAASTDKDVIISVYDPEWGSAPKHFRLSALVKYWDIEEHDDEGLELWERIAKGLEYQAKVIRTRIKKR